MKIVIASDHAGVDYKARLISYLEYNGFIVSDFGPETEDSVDYPDYAHKVAKEVSEGKVDFGILLCGSGNGINMSANKHKEIRSALCWKKEIALLARLHNNANILTMPARFISYEQAQEITNIFLTTEFEGGRHQKRVNKIAII
ncbi:ribose 5-phosphate isomerase B [Flavobacteriales bacterium]|jgi:ribose 5-phosphate isomerase B|nr:ribose 5-phosphate isomerase B [Flavobacteriales bacterium]|tara:strand:- start:336 stop:767 length:432 start_codon:yes stop_codon:yes gene_type:complete